MNCIKMIKTFIFLDLETTGLPMHENYKTKITEMSLVAVNRSHLNSGEIPRILNKLNLCFNPYKPISPQATNITGMDNEYLDCMKPFSESTYNLLIHFFEQLATPICLVAHNGNMFDFPILNYHLKYLNKEFSDDILCVDSLPAFRFILIPPITKEPVSESEIAFLEDEMDDVLFSTASIAEMETNSINSEKLPSGIINLQQLRNETTPEKSKKPVSTFRKEGTDTVDRAVPPRIQPKARKRLDFDQYEKPKSFKLKDLYSFIIKRELANAHQAEVDVYALMKCCGALHKQFMEYADLECQPLNRIDFFNQRKKNILR